jgi:general secretion pathway protein L
VHQALLPLHISVEDLTFIVFGEQYGRAAPLIRLWRIAQVQNSWRRRLVPQLCCSVVLLMLASAGLRYLNQQAALDRLGTEIAAATANAQQVRALVDQLRERRGALARLRLQKSEAPGLIDIWDETTRVLPHHSWLTELRVTEGSSSRREKQVTLIGFSKAAPSLVGIVDGSRLFFDAALTSPVSFDATEGRERFALQANVRLPETLKEAAR